MLVLVAVALVVVLDDDVVLVAVLVHGEVEVVESLVVDASTTQSEDGPTFVDDGFVEGFESCAWIWT